VVNIRHFKELRVWQVAMDVAMRIFEMTKRFPPEERYSMTDQMRRSSRSVAANIAEAWRKRRYPAAFVSKLSDAETEAAETQTWLEFAARCGYLTKDEAHNLSEEYERLCSQLIVMIENPHDWTIHPSPRPRVAVSPRPQQTASPRPQQTASPRQQEKEHRA
jgi:four helix bundle protein